jgi:hypothetical protein
MCCPFAESLDYFQQGDSSADEGGPGTDEAVPGSAMDTGSPSTATNYVRRTSSNTDNPPAESSALCQAPAQRQASCLQDTDNPPAESSELCQAPAQRQASCLQDVEPDTAGSSGMVMAPGATSATTPASAASTANTLNANSDAGKTFSVPSC